MHERRDAAVKKAMALGYERSRDTAPRVLAKGGGDVADSILETARLHGVPIERDPDLLQCLQPLATGAEIPIAAYEAVARILAFLYQKNRS